MTPDAPAGVSRPRSAIQISDAPGDMRGTARSRDRSNGTRASPIDHAKALTNLVLRGCCTSDSARGGGGGPEGDQQPESDPSRNLMHQTAWKHQFNQ